MKLINSGTLLLLALFAADCCASPILPKGTQEDAALTRREVYARAKKTKSFSSSASKKTGTVAVAPKAAAKTTNTVATAKPTGTATASSSPKSAPQPAAAVGGGGQMIVGPPVLLSQLTADVAGGGVPSGPPPQTSFSPNAIANFKVANFIEGIESGFFAQALQSLSQDRAFTAASPVGKSIQNITGQIAAQELVHKATLEGLLGLAMVPPVPACQSIKSVTDTNDFLAKANIVTSAAIGVIISITQSLSASDGPNLLGPLSSILVCESQQDAFFRMSGTNSPSASPFSTALSMTYAYNIALEFVDVRSCPQLLPLPILPSLNVTSPLVAVTAPAVPPISVTFTASNVPTGDLFIGWVNQANPVTYSKVTIANGVGTADIPGNMTGMAFAALTSQNAAMTVDGLTNVTIAGPAAILMS